MDRLDFFEKLKCQNDFVQCFDSLMSVYDIVSRCDVRNIELIESNSLSFKLVSNNPSMDLLNLQSISLTRYNKDYDLNIVKNKDSSIEFLIRDRVQ